VVATTVASGVPSLDVVLGGGLLEGDNVIWVDSHHEAYTVVERSFLEASARERPTVFVACTPSALRRRMPPGTRRLNATPGGRLADAPALGDELEALLGRHGVSSIVVEDFAELAHRWGDDEAARFFVRSCPTMLQAGAVTYWRATSGMNPALLEACRQVTQCLLELSPTKLAVVKAEGRRRTVQGSVHHVELDADSVVVVPQSTNERLARGLVRLRRDFGLTQAQLATAAGVTPSAISQAESGTRGLAVDTLLLLSDQLGVTIDRVLNAEPAEVGYRLRRHDRIEGRRGVVPLVDDTSVGLRAFFVRLDGGERRAPPAAHASPQLVAVVEGLVQVALGGDTPVLRAGDSLLAETLTVGWWQNLRARPAMLYWILRDELRRPPDTDGRVQQR
jgi:transcriptional regulator with XRE-family HTH domain